jgi:hypothetical protein
MAYVDEILDRLGAKVPCGYHDGGPASTEPTALAAIALTAHGRQAPATQALGWLAGLQAADGSVGPTASQATPGWPTSLAVLAALYAKTAGIGAGSTGQKGFNIDRGVNWILETRGESLPRTPEMGHDATLVGWPWIEETHSWVEPTAMHVLALKAAGHAEHPRTREAVRLLVDRLLPGGGCNYGNTVVMDQVLRPHLQPTGLAMLALAGEQDRDGRIAKSLDYLSRELSTKTPAASVSYGLMGLAAHDRLPAADSAWLETAYRRTIARDAAPYRLALIALAAMGTKGPLHVAGWNAKHG